MTLIAGLSFGLFTGALVALFLHPVFRLRLSPERRQRLLLSTIGSLLGTGVAGALLALLGRDAVVGMVSGIFPGFLAAYGYLEWRDRQQLQKVLDLTPAEQQVAERVLTGQLDPTDPTSAQELSAMLDRLGGKKGDGA